MQSWCWQTSLRYLEYIQLQILCPPRIWISLNWVVRWFWIFPVDTLILWLGFLIFYWGTHIVCRLLHGFVQERCQTYQSDRFRPALPSLAGLWYKYDVDLHSLGIWINAKQSLEYPTYDRNCFFYLIFTEDFI